MSLVVAIERHRRWSYATKLHQFQRDRPLSLRKTPKLYLLLVASNHRRRRLFPLFQHLKSQEVTKSYCVSCLLNTLSLTLDLYVIHSVFSSDCLRLLVYNGCHRK
nr:hypothetical protein CFP56_63827 [Quercus suber]